MTWKVSPWAKRACPFTEGSNPIEWPGCLASGSTTEGLGKWELQTKPKTLCEVDSGLTPRVGKLVPVTLPKATSRTKVVPLPPETLESLRVGLEQGLLVVPLVTPGLMHSACRFCGMPSQQWVKCQNTPPVTVCRAQAGSLGSSLGKSCERPQGRLCETTRPALPVRRPLCSTLAGWGGG